MVISQRGIDLIKEFEGCRLTAYKDAVGVWTMIPATINAVAVLIGALIGISQIAINKEGRIVETK